jgi:signal transduction histidine kinase
MLDVNLEGRLPEATEALLFRGAQEAARNILTHARAGVVAISVRIEGGLALVEILDDGEGFTREQLDARRSAGHVGLRMLTDLAEEAGGKLDISSAPGRGTTVRLEVPIA